MSEPGGPLLLAADECDPLIAAAAKAFPNIRVAIHASLLLRLLERASGGGADTMRKRLVVPKGRVLQHEPPSGLADSTPSLALIAVSPDPSRGVKVAFKSQFLLAGDHVGILGVHVLSGRRNLLLVESSVQIRRVREIGVVTAKAAGITVALKHPEKAMRQKRLGRGIVVDVGLPLLLLGHLRWKLGGKQHAVPLEDRSAGDDEWGLLHCLEVAIVEGQRRGANSRRRVAGKHLLVIVVHVLARVVGVLSRLSAHRGSVSACGPSLDSRAFDTVRSRSYVDWSWRRRSATATALSSNEVGPGLRGHSR